MRQAYSHPWPADERGAVLLQTQLAKLVVREDRLGPIRTVAGVDVAYDKHSDKLVAAVVVLDIETLQVVAQASAQDVEKFPYVPGLFSFRELPPIALALAQLDAAPDLIVCDGKGIARRPPARQTSWSRKSWRPARPVRHAMPRQRSTDAGRRLA